MPRRQAHRQRSGRARAILTLAGIAALAILVLGARTAGSSDRGREAASTPPVAGAMPSGAASGSDPIASTSPEPGGAPAAPVVPAPNREPPHGPATLFPGGLLIADRGNGRLLVVDAAGRVLWRFPKAGALPRGQHFSADDAFIAPDRRTIVANDENHQVIDRIDIATGRLVWQYGTYDRAGRGRGQLNTPDDAYPLANGDVVVADIRNCRILEVAPSKRIVRSRGRPGRCVDRPPAAFDEPNGDTPLPDGGLLVTEIVGSRVVRLDARGRVVFDVHVPVSYPSDAQLDSHGDVLVVDYSSPGAIVRMAPNGHVLWRYQVTHGKGRLDHPSLAVPLANGLVALNDDGRDRVLVIDPRTNRIVWQYGHTDRASRKPGFLSIPDGIDALPPGVVFAPGAQPR